MHIHKFNDEMQYYLEGEGDFRVGKNWCNIKPERIIYIPKGTVHGRPIRETVTLIALFTPKFDISKPDRAFVDEDGNQYS
jgi:quercetin dioxygenase-like cupin family protein